MKRTSINKYAPATIHKHQCLLVMHTGTAQALALPSALIDHPSCRNLLMLPIDGIMRHTRIQGCQSIILRLLYDRIHEEAARIALHLRVRQLGIADLDDDITKLLRCRMFDILSRQRCTDDVVAYAVEHEFYGAENLSIIPGEVGAWGDYP